VRERATIPSDAKPISSHTVLFLLAYSLFRSILGRLLFPYRSLNSKSKSQVCASARLLPPTPSLLVAILFYFYTGIFSASDVKFISSTTVFFSCF